MGESPRQISDSQALILLKSLEPAPETVTRRQKWISAIPLFLLYLFFGAASWLTTVNEDVMRQFSSSAIGTFCTDLLLLWNAFLAEQPFVFPTAMFAVAWFYFGVFARTPMRLWWFSRITGMLALLWFFILMLGVLLPLTRFQNLR